MSVIAFPSQVNKEDCLVYDPIFCDMEKEMIKEYSCSLITKNEVVLIYFCVFLLSLNVIATNPGLD